MAKNKVPEPNRQVPVPGSLDSCKVSPSSLVLRIELGKLRQCDVILSFPLKYETKKIKNSTPPSVLEKTLESPLDCKKIQPVHPKGDQSWVFIGRTDVEAETPILWPPDVKN